MNQDAENLCITPPDQTASVLKALKNEKYTWRTVKGVATDTGLSEDRVRMIFNQEVNEVVFSNYHTPSGAQLFASRQHLLSKTSPWEQISGSFRNRIF